MIDSRDIKELHPIVLEKTQAFIAKCKENGIDALITSTYRDNAAQDALYAKGRTKPGAIVTNAKAGQSFHNYRVAFDFVPIVHGKPDWNNTETFKKCGEIAESVGLEWAGRWKKFKEMAHCQYTGGLTLKDFQNGKKL
jgi:peptidoglycan L-alanyl-D-glutamate endopeptidase CwlK